MAQLRSQRDAPGTQREYETIYILRAEAATEAIQDVNTRVRKVIEDSGGRVIRVDNWGKRKLAYEIKKQLKGIYLYWLYLGQADLVAEIERNLRMLDLVIRFNSVRIDEDVNPDARPSEMDEERFLAAATTVPDEEDAYMGRGYQDEEEGPHREDDEDEGGFEAVAVDHDAPSPAVDHDSPSPDQGDAGTDTSHAPEPEEEK
jgi:small subunit ribosomal protein S6